MKLHYRKTGPARSGGPAMVFVHGAGGSSNFFAKQFDAFRDLMTCYFLDLPGHGESHHPVEEPSIDMYAREVMRFIDYLPAPAILVGHSMGGAVALSAALSEPALLHSLVLVTTGGRLPVPASWLTALDEDYDKALSVLLRHCFSRSADSALLEQTREAFRRTDPVMLRADFRASSAFDVCGRLAEIEVPALIIGAGEDRIVPLSFSEQLRVSIPNSRLETVPAGSHMLMLEQSDTFNRLLRSLW